MVVKYLSVLLAEDGCFCLIGDEIYLLFLFCCSCLIVIRLRRWRRKLLLMTFSYIWALKVPVRLQSKHHELKHALVFVFCSRKWKLSHRDVNLLQSFLLSTAPAVRLIKLFCASLGPGFMVLCKGSGDATARWSGGGGLTFHQPVCIADIPHSLTNYRPVKEKDGNKCLV